VVASSCLHAPWLRVVVSVALILDLLVLCGDVIAYLNRNGSSILPDLFRGWLRSTEDGSVGELYGHLNFSPLSPRWCSSGEPLRQVFTRSGH
jgi:hypothetical protein